jgi:hypothetical protein
MHAAGHKATDEPGHAAKQHPAPGAKDAAAKDVAAKDAPSKYAEGAAASPSPAAKAAGAAISSAPVCACALQGFASKECTEALDARCKEKGGDKEAKVACEAAPKAATNSTAAAVLASFLAGQCFEGQGLDVSPCQCYRVGTRACVYVYARLCVRAHVCACARTCVRALAHVCVHVCVSEHANMCVSHCALL